METNQYRNSVPKADIKAFINLMPNSHFLQWYMSLHHEVELKQAQLRLASEASHSCLGKENKKKKELQKELNNLREQKDSSKLKVAQIKKELYENNFVERLQNSCGRVVFYSDSAEAFADGECYIKVHAVLEYLEARQKIYALMQKAERLDQLDFVQIHNVTKDLLGKVLA